MRTMRAGRTAMAIAAAFISFAMSASPASADPGEITSGEIDITHLSTPLHFDLPGSGTDPCPNNPVPDPTIDVDFNSPAAGQVEVTAFSAKSRFQVAGDPNWYQLDLQLEPFLAPHTGTFAANPTPPNYRVNDVGVGLRGTIYKVVPGQGETDCAKNDPVCQNIGLEVVLSGSYVGTVPPTTGDTAVVSGSTSPDGININIGGPCPNAFFASFHGEVVDITNLTFVFD